MAGPLLIEDQTPQLNERSAALMAQVLQFQQRQALDERQQMDIEAYRQQQLANTQNRLAFDQQKDQQKQSQMAADAQGVASGQVVPGMTAGGINTMTLVQQRAMQERERRFSSAVSFLQPYVLSGSKMAQYNLDALASDHFGQDMTGMGESLFRGQLDKFVAQKDYEAKAKEEQRRRESEAAMNFFGIENPSFSGMSPTLQGQYLAEQARQQREAEKQMAPAEFEQAVADFMTLNPRATRQQAEARVRSITGYGVGQRFSTLDTDTSQRERIDPAKKELAKLDLDAAKDELAALTRELEAMDLPSKNDPIHTQIQDAKRRVKEATQQYRRVLAGDTGSGQQSSEARANAGSLTPEQAMARAKAELPNGTREQVNARAQEIWRGGS